jgi:tetratricopeptide (TPR) repeat protein
MVYPGTPLLEREEELAGIEAALAGAAAGSGSVVVLQGPAGIGKSRLLVEADARGRRAGVRILRARGGELERDFPFGIARQLFEPALVALAEAERCAALAGAAALAAPVVWADEEPAGSDAGDRLFAMVHGLYWLCLNLGSRAPFVMLVDDAQWADEQSLRWLAYLARRLEDVPVALVLAVRADEAGPSSRHLDPIVAEPCARTFRLAPLGVDAVAQFIATTVGTAPAAEVAAACHQRCAGNPFVLRELTLSLSRAGLPLDRPDSADEVRNALPGTVARSVLERLGRLQPSAVALARAVAVLGTDAQLGDASQLAGLDDGSAAMALDALVAAGFLMPVTPLRFVHPLMREAIYGEIPVGRRRYQHRRAADLLDGAVRPEVVAAHLLECEPNGNQHSASVLRRCGARAMARGAPESAVRYLARAVAERADRDSLGTLVRELGVAEARLGRAEALEHLEEALALATTAADECAATAELALALAGRGRWADAATTLEDGIGALGGADHELELRLIGELCAIGQLELSFASRVAERLHAVAPALAGRTPGERLVLASYAHLRSNENAGPDELAELAQRALGDGLLLAEQSADSPAFYLLMYVLHRADRDDLADHWLAAALASARERGSLFGTSVGLAVRGQLRWLRGELVDAEADARMSIDAQLEAGWTSVLPLAVHAVAECMLERGEAGAALELFEQSGLGGALPELMMSRWAQATRGRVLIAVGRVDEGIADLFGCEREPMGTQSGLGLLWRTDVALALAARGDSAGARELAREQLARASEHRVARIYGVALRTMGMVADTDEAPDWLGQAVDVRARSSARLE